MKSPPWGPPRTPVTRLAPPPPPPSSIAVRCTSLVLPLRLCKKVSSSQEGVSRLQITGLRSYSRWRWRRSRRAGGGSEVFVLKQAKIDSL